MSNPPAFRRFPSNGWPLLALNAAWLVTMVVLILALQGAQEAGWRSAVRATARTSVLLFSAAFVASALATLFPRPATRWLLRNRRYLGVSFAVSHALHLLSVLALAAHDPDFRLDPVTLVGGGTAYVFLAAMAATSFDRTAAWLGPTWWKRLHTVGAYYLWLIFFVSYGPEAVTVPVYRPFALLLVGALALRIVMRRAIAPVASP